MKPPITMDRPPPTCLASFAAAAVVGMGAIALQAAWPAALAGTSALRGWQLPALLVAATAFLLATLVCHLRHSRQLPGIPNILPSNFAGLACDLAVGLAAAATLFAGHQAAVVGQGLWIVPPILLAACASSALAGLFAWRQRGVRRWRDWSELLRIAFAAIVVAFLAIQW